MGRRARLLYVADNPEGRYGVGTLSKNRFAGSSRISRDLNLDRNSSAILVVPAEKEYILSGGAVRVIAYLMIPGKVPIPFNPECPFTNWPDAAPRAKDPISVLPFGIHLAAI